MMQTALILVLGAFLQTDTPAPGVVYGRAIDAAGRPIVGTTVELLGYSRRHPILIDAFSDHPELQGILTGETNDRGEFRLFDVSPGQYFLRVSPPGKRTDELSPLGAVFYPGVAGLSKATKVEVRAGEEVRAGNLVLTPSPMGPIRVRTTNLAVGNPSGLGMPSLFGGPARDNPPATAGLVGGVPAIRPDEPGDYRVCTSLMFTFETPTRMALERNACGEVRYTGAPQDITLVIKNPVGYWTGRVMFGDRQLRHGVNGAEADPQINIKRLVAPRTHGQHNSDRRSISQHSRAQSGG